MDSKTRTGPGWAKLVVAAFGLLFLSEGAITSATPQGDIEASKEQGPTDAERLLRLEKVVELDRQKLADLEEELRQKEEMFSKVSEVIETATAALEEKNQKLNALDRGADAAAVTVLETEIAGLESRIATAKAQSEVSFQAAKTAQVQVEALKKKITQEEKAIAAMVGSPLESEGSSQTTPTDAPGTESVPAASTLQQGVVPIPGVQSPGGPSTETPPARGPETAEQIEARREAEKLATQAEQAEIQVHDFLERKAALEEQIDLENQLLRTARETRDNLSEYLTERRMELRQLISAGASQQSLDELQDEIDDVQQLILEARAEIDRRDQYVDSLRERLDDLHEEQLVLTEEADQRRLEAEAALKKTVWLESPLHPQNLDRWLRTRGPRILLVLLVAGLLLALVRMTVRRIARTVVRTSRGVDGEGTNRADTLALSFSSAATMIIIVAGALLVLQEAGVDIKTVLGGAAILGVAFAFGAQNMMRDYFSGFMILIEDQFELGDLVTIGGITGRVEKVNMRTTMLRDIEGRVHFIPNGEIKAITNRTYVWGRAVLEVPIAITEDVDRVMEELLEVARQMRRDPEWEDTITDDPTMLGVDRFTESGVIIKFMVQTRPDRIFPTRRELLRRVKNRFDEVGIQISVPYRQILKTPDPED